MEHVTLKEITQIVTIFPSFSRGTMLLAKSSYHPIIRNAVEVNIAVDRCCQNFERGNLQRTKEKCTKSMPQVQLGQSLLYF